MAFSCFFIMLKRFRFYCRCVFEVKNAFFLDFLQKKHHLCLDIVIFIIFVHH